jgi:hypothetical protein
MLPLVGILLSSASLFYTLRFFRRKWFLYQIMRERDAQDRACVKAALRGNATLFEPYEERLLVEWVLQDLDRHKSMEWRVQESFQRWSGSKPGRPSKSSHV